MSQVSRRSAVALGAGVLVAGCSSRSGDPAAPPPPSAPASGTTGPSSSTTPAPSATSHALPAVRTWHPDPGDIAPRCKLTAVRRVEAAGNGPARALEVIDAQYGGLLTDSASVLVVTRSWTRHGHRIIAGGHTFDVRLSRATTGWRVTAIHPSRPGPPASTLTPSARRVLASDRITLPPAGRRDILSGAVHDSVLAAMLTMSASYRVDVSVVRSGHPIFVFGTDRHSDHPPGRAFDTWAINGRAVVDARTPRSLVEDYMRAAAAAGSYNVGGPYLLGSAPQWFSDDTHHDHVHAGFTT